MKRPLSSLALLVLAGSTLVLVAPAAALNPPEISVGTVARSALARTAALDPIGSRVSGTGATSSDESTLGLSRLLPAGDLDGDGVADVLHVARAILLTERFPVPPAGVATEVVSLSAVSSATGGTLWGPLTLSRGLWPLDNDLWIRPLAHLNADATPDVLVFQIDGGVTLSRLAGIDGSNGKDLWTWIDAGVGVGTYQGSPTHTAAADIATAVPLGVADMDRDGSDDVVMGRYSRGKGPGSYGRPLPTSGEPTIDAAGAWLLTAFTISGVNGRPTGVPHATVGLGLAPAAVPVPDMTGDGAPDLITAIASYGDNQLADPSRGQSVVADVILWKSGTLEMVWRKQHSAHRLPYVFGLSLWPTSLIADPRSDVLIGYDASSGNFTGPSALIGIAWTGDQLFKAEMPGAALIRTGTGGDGTAYVQTLARYYKGLLVQTWEGVGGRKVSEGYDAFTSSNGWDIRQYGMSALTVIEDNYRGSAAFHGYGTVGYGDYRSVVYDAWPVTLVDARDGGVTRGSVANVAWVQAGPEYPRQATIADRESYPTWRTAIPGLDRIETAPSGAATDITRDGTPDPIVTLGWSSSSGVVRRWHNGTWAFDGATGAPLWART